MSTKSKSKRFAGPTPKFALLARVELLDSDLKPLGIVGDVDGYTWSYGGYSYHVVFSKLLPIFGTYTNVDERYLRAARCPTWRFLFLTGTTHAWETTWEESMCWDLPTLYHQRCTHCGAERTV